jgi:hypothetical protein
VRYWLIWSFFVLSRVATIVALVVLNWLFYRKARVFPRAIITFEVGMLALDVLKFFAYLASLRPHAAMHGGFIVFAGVINVAIWVPYFQVSRRVKVTFVH